jgi:hypothetical protein
MVGKEEWPFRSNKGMPGDGSFCLALPARDVTRVRHGAVNGEADTITLV